MITGNSEARINALENRVTSLEAHPQIIGNSDDFYDLKDGDSASLSIDIPEDGIYLVTTIVNQCGASGITQAGAFWSVAGTGIGYNNFTWRGSYCIPISRAWDSPHFITFYKQYIKGNYTFDFTNHTGIATSGTYGSNCMIRAIKILDV